MTKDEALKLALEALGNTWTEPKSEQYKIEKETITAIKEALAQEQEPVAWRAKQFYEYQEGWFYAEWHLDGLTPQVAELLYTSQPQRTWIGLTDEEVKNFVQAVWPREATPADYIHAIEAKLKEKNL